MFYACYIKWFTSVREAFEEASYLENPTFRIRSQFSEGDAVPLTEDLEKVLIQECYNLGYTSGCIAEIVLPVTQEVEGKYWVQDRQWATRSKTPDPENQRYYFPTS